MLLKAFQIDTNEIAEVNYVNSLVKPLQNENISGSVVIGVGGEIFVFLPTRDVCIDFSGKESVLRSIVDKEPEFDVIFSIQKNNSQVGTITFKPGTKVGIFNGISVSISRDDIITIIAPLNVSNLHRIHFTFESHLL